MSRVFISYDEEDKAFVKKAAKMLDDRGFQTWFYTRDSVPGLDYPTQVAAAFKDSKAILLVVSFSSITSRQVENEVLLAHQQGKRIIPLLLKISHERFQQRMPNSWQFVLGAAVAIRVDEDSIGEHLPQLIGGLRQAGVEPSPEDERCTKTKQHQGDVPGANQGTHPSFPKVVLPGSPTDYSVEVHAVVARAQYLAAKCGADRVTHRLLLAAFLSKRSQFAVRACRAAGVDTDLLYAVLLQLSLTKRKPDATSVTEIARTQPEFAWKIVLRVLGKARDRAGHGHAVTEADLFRAFCDCATPGFVDFLKSFAPADRALDDHLCELLEIDLKAMKDIDPDRLGLMAGLTLRARKVIGRAHQLALGQRVCPLPNRLLLAAFLFDEEAYASRLCQRLEWPARRLKDKLIESVGTGAADPFPLDDKACMRIVKPVIERARAIAGKDEIVTERLLFEAFCQKTAPALKTSLKTAGFDLDSLPLFGRAWAAMSRKPV